MPLFDRFIKRKYDGAPLQRVLFDKRPASEERRILAWPFSRFGSEWRVTEFAGSIPVNESKCNGEGEAVALAIKLGKEKSIPAKRQRLGEDETTVWAPKGG